MPINVMEVDTFTLDWNLLDEMGHGRCLFRLSPMAFLLAASDPSPSEG